jgi:hypothetical protein
MSSFKDFFFSVEKVENAIPTVQQSEKALSASIVGSLTSVSVVGGSDFTIAKKEEFSNNVSKLAHSEEFIQDLSNSIGKPRPDESEDAFVLRAKAAMTALLKEKLKD